MALRFQRRIKIAPGLRLNISKGGVSVSENNPGQTTILMLSGFGSTPACHDWQQSTRYR